MKSFSQFLQESYLNEEIPAGMTRAQYNALPAQSRRRLSGGSSAAYGKKGQPLQGAASDPAIRSARKSMSGQQAAAVTGVTAAGGAATLAANKGDDPAKPKLNDMLDKDIKTTKVSSPAKKLPTSKQVWAQMPAKPKKQYGIPNEGPSSRLPGRKLAPAGGTNPKAALPPIGSRESGGDLAKRTSRNPGIPDAMMQGAQDAANRTNTPRSGKPPRSGTTSSVKTPKPSSSASSSTYRNVGVGKETFATKPSQSQPQTSSGSQKQKWNPQSERARKSGETTDAWRERIMQQKTSGKPSSSAIVPSGKPSSSAIVPAGKPTSSAMAPAGKPPSGPKIKVPSGLAKVGRVAGKIAGPASAALDVADERAKGSGWARSLAKGAVVAAGGALGGAAGSVAGPVGSVGGAVGGSMAASKAFDVAAGANAKERKAMATANRQRQAGTAIKGIGGKTTFDTKKNTMTTGTGSQRKTVQLAKTGVVQRGGQSTAGHLAYKGGKAVYKAGPSAQSLAKTSSNPLERIGRSLFAGAYKKHDAAKAQQALAKARQSDAARNKALGVKALPGK